MEPKIVGFVQRQLCERGTTIALYDYAIANEELCGNVSVVFYQANNHLNHRKVVEKFKERFTVIEYVHWRDIESYIEELSIDYLYVIKHGPRDEYNTTKIPCLLHSVFAWDPHGIYACVSKKIAIDNGGRWLPHIVSPLPFVHGFRKAHGIPEDAYVYGRYGGKDTFSIEYTKEVIREDIDKFPNVWFVFVNTNKFINHPRVLFLNELISPIEKGSFIKECDAMVHGRLEGETFGLAIAEFVSLGKPVLSCKAVYTTDNEHIYLGKDWITVYNDKEDFRRKVWGLLKCPMTENPYSVFSPKNVMETFGSLLGNVEQFKEAI